MGEDQRKTFAVIGAVVVAVAVLAVVLLRTVGPGGDKSYSDELTKIKGTPDPTATPLPAAPRGVIPGMPPTAERSKGGASRLPGATAP